MPPTTTNTQLVSRVGQLKAALDSIEAAKQRNVGRQSLLLEQLHNTYGLENSAEANQKIAEIKRKINNKYATLERKYNLLVEENPWIEET